MGKGKQTIHYEQDKPLHRKGKRRTIVAIIACLLIASGLYMLILVNSPNLPISSPIDLNTSDDADDLRNRIQIEKINLEVPYFSENTPASLEKGAWWRFPERGNPEMGGNFIISAHRFFLGTTPQQTRARSPFYNLDELGDGDKIRIFYEGTWYDYQVTKEYSVAPDATEIEDASDEPRLTLYTCSLKGSADGRVVIEAKPLFETAAQNPPTDGSPLL